jgi:hypothetical protein
VIFELALVLGVGGAAVGMLRALRTLRGGATPEGSELGKALAAARAKDRGLVSGDVLMIPGEELALGGVLALDEGGHVLSAFALIGAARDRWLVQLDEAGRDLALVSETSDVGEGPVPSELPIGGRTLTLERRGTARVEGKGEGVPTLDAQRAPYVVLAERGGRIAIVIDLPGQRLALTGERLDPRVVDRLGGGTRLTP